MTLGYLFAGYPFHTNALTSLCKRHLNFFTRSLLRGPAHSENALFPFLLWAYHEQCVYLYVKAPYLTQHTYFNKIFPPSFS